MGKCDVRTFENPEELARGAAEEWLNELASIQQDYFAAFSGGRIGRTFLQQIMHLTGATIHDSTIHASTVHDSRFNDSTIQRFHDSPLHNYVHFFWADERCVPPADPESNYRVAFDELLHPAEIPADHIHRIRGEEPPTVAARRADEEMRRFVPVNSAGWPELDVIFLGMGEDGHVASLFPPIRNQDERTCFIPVTASKPPPNRISMTYEIIAAAKSVWVLASGQGKVAALRESLRPDGTTPLAEVIRRRSVTNLLTDIA